MTDITVIDACMGQGKSSWAYQYMNQTAGIDTIRDFGDDKSFLYITPFLSETVRAQEECPSLDFYTPEPINGRKLENLNALIIRGENIASTHSLFTLMDTDSSEALEGAGYTLIIDEEVEFVSRYDELGKLDKKLLFEENVISVEPDTGRVRWNHELYGIEDYPNHKYSNVRALCDNGKLVVLNDKFWLWEFPHEFLTLFDHVYIMTYMHEGSFLSTYLRLNDLYYTVKTVTGDRESGYELAPYDAEAEAAKLRKFRDLINVVDDDKLNAVGLQMNRRGPGQARKMLSKSWYNANAKLSPDDPKNGLEVLRRNLGNLYRQRWNGGADISMWSTFGTFKPQLRGKGYATGFLAVNAKATNEYADRKNLAYCVNLFAYSEIRRYFNAHGLTVNDDLYAISQLVQWIWRSCIRVNEPINLYLPSSRMRSLLNDWLDGKFSTDERRLPSWQLEPIELKLVS